ncbi:hypothetical protein IFM89_002921 [Coptis chinensis]|uniref:Coiled-coil domain-containing protein 86 n=1 Tax=Coptis chinensis TaxID=261450 RepID=A0A835MCP7_9MAGN|nr:hypothetical protein IFM89_002921 [Coptis chinensis]
MACTLDFRFLDEGLGGTRNKRKRDDNNNNNDSSMDLDDNNNNNTEDNNLNRPSKRLAIPSLTNPEKPFYGKPSYDGVIAGKVSGRKWKQVRQQRSSSSKVSLKKSTYEERAKEKEIKKAYKERITELKEEIRLNKVEKRKKNEEREKKKKENILKSGTMYQKITNPKTLKKIQKSKDRKKLRQVPDDMLKKNK